MPTTVPLAFREVETELLLGKSPATTRNADLLAIVAFATIGLALTIGFAVLFPLATNTATLALAVT
jgi:hypothetical protein